jgi:hypothetical protein
MYLTVFISLCYIPQTIEEITVKCGVVASALKVMETFSFGRVSNTLKVKPSL